MRVGRYSPAAVCSGAGYQQACSSMERGQCRQTPPQRGARRATPGCPFTARSRHAFALGRITPQLPRSPKRLPLTRCVGAFLCCYLATNGPAAKPMLLKNLQPAPGVSYHHSLSLGSLPVMNNCGPGPAAAETLASVPPLDCQPSQLFPVPSVKVLYHTPPEDVSDAMKILPSAPAICGSTAIVPWPGCQRSKVDPAWRPIHTAL